MESDGMELLNDLLMAETYDDSQELMDIEEILITTIDPLAVIESKEQAETPLLLTDIEVPCFMVRNVIFEEELPYILRDEGIPVYYSDGTTNSLLGKMPATLDVVLRAKFLDTGISFIDKDRMEKDLNDPGELLRFITIPPDFLNNGED